MLPLSLGVAAFYYASPVNNYEFLHPHIPQWLVLQDKLVVKAFYEGSPDGKVPWRDWLPALSAWTLSTVLLWVCLLGLTFLFRRRWIDEEKLVFPVAQVPLAMMDEQKAVWNSKPFWLGFLFPFLLHCWNSLAVYFPVFPSLNLHAINITSLFTEPPWVIGVARRFLPFCHRCRLYDLNGSRLGLVVFPLPHQLGDGCALCFGFPSRRLRPRRHQSHHERSRDWRFLCPLRRVGMGDLAEAKDGSLNERRESFLVFTIGLIALTAFWTFMGADWWASLAYFFHLLRGHGRFSETFLSSRFHVRCDGLSSSQH